MLRRVKSMLRRSNYMFRHVKLVQGEERASNPSLGDWPNRVGDFAQRALGNAIAFIGGGRETGVEHSPEEWLICGIPTTMH